MNFSYKYNLQALSGNDPAKDNEKMADLQSNHPETSFHHPLYLCDILFQDYHQMPHCVLLNLNHSVLTAILLLGKSSGHRKSNLDCNGGEAEFLCDVLPKII